MLMIFKTIKIIRQMCVIYYYYIYLCSTNKEINNNKLKYKIMKANELTKNEREVLVAIVANAKKVGDSGVEFILQDVAKETGKSIRSVSATTGSLANKGMLVTANGDSYFDGELTEAGLHELESSNVNNKQ